MIKALGDEDKDTREGAAEALGKIGDPRAVKPLTEEIKYRGQREWSILAVRERLEKELEEIEVREAAKAALNKIRRESKGKRRR